MASSSLIDQVREIPLESVLAHHGLAPRREGSTTRYKNDEVNIVVSDQGLWFDNAASVGGRGAIDLVLHLRSNVQPRIATPHQIHEALQWLRELPHSAVPLSSSTTQLEKPENESFASQSARLAIRDDARWPMVRDYLVRARRLPRDLVEEVHERGDVYATYSENRPEQTQVCFAHRNLAGEICGATARTAATGKGFFVSIGEKQGAWFTLGEPRTAQTLVVVEAPIDALSFHALRSTESTVILATSCAHVFRPILQAAHDKRCDLVIALDNDRAGNTGWKRCRDEYTALCPADPGPHRISPVTKDWNDDLRSVMGLGYGRHR